MAAVETTGPVLGRQRTYQAGVAGMGRGIAVMQGADDAHVIPATAGAQCLGILEEASVNAGDPVSVIFAGEAVVVVGAPVVAPVYLIANGTGQLIPTAAAGDNIVARAVSSASVAGDYAVALLLPFVR